jgi:hypothetical protein
LAIAAVDSYSLARVSYSECRYPELMAVLESSAGLDLSVSFLVSDLWEWSLGSERWDSFAALCCPDSAPLFQVLARLPRAPGPLFQALGPLCPEQA